MPLEIERKFLVKGDFRQHAISHTRIVQGYICAEAGRTVRVRLLGEEAFLTIKGPSLQGGIARYEFETPIDSNEALSLLYLCPSGYIDKERWIVPQGNHRFEVDVFAGANEGLVIAEIELSHADEAFERPEWLGQEVTGQARYYNSALVARPYQQWTAHEREE